MFTGKSLPKSLSSVAVAALLASTSVLSSCSSKSSETEGTTSAAETTAVTSASQEETTASETEEMTSVPETEETTTEETTTVNGRDTTPYEQITLDGERDHHFIATDFCFIESEQCVIFMEKDIEIPGDFVINVEAIIDEIEKELGIPYDPDHYQYSDLIDMSVYFGMNPWEDWNVGRKIPIFLVVDREDVGRIPSACNEYALFCMYEMFSDDLWKSVPSYRDNDWRRMDHIDYNTIAHELTHTIQGRNCELTSIMTEGIAELMGMSVVDALADSYPSIALTKESFFLYDYAVPEMVNAENAERIFIEDYNQIDAAGRGAEYVYGRYLWQFLFEKNGADAFSKYVNKVIAVKLTYNYGNYDEEIMGKYAELLKELYGEDVFTKFGDWCVEHNALQSLEGVAYE